MWHNISDTKLLATSITFGKIPNKAVIGPETVVFATGYETPIKYKATHYLDNATFFIYAEDSLVAHSYSFNSTTNNSTLISLVGSGTSIGFDSNSDYFGRCLIVQQPDSISFHLQATDPISGDSGGTFPMPLPNLSVSKLFHSVFDQYFLFFRDANLLNFAPPHFDYSSLTFEIINPSIASIPNGTTGPGVVTNIFETSEGLLFGVGVATVGAFDVFYLGVAGDRRCFDAATYQNTPSLPRCTCTIPILTFQNAVGQSVSPDYCRGDTWVFNNSLGTLLTLYSFVFCKFQCLSQCGRFLGHLTSS
jgi:hypothetical protein